MHMKDNFNIFLITNLNCGLTCGASIYILYPVILNLQLCRWLYWTSLFTSFICETTCDAEECNNVGKAEWAVCCNGEAYQFYLAFYTVKLESIFLTAGHSESGVKYNTKDIFKKLKKNGNLIHIVFYSGWVRTRYMQSNWKCLLYVPITVYTQSYVQSVSGIPRNILVSQGLVFCA